MGLGTGLGTLESPFLSSLVVLVVSAVGGMPDFLGRHPEISAKVGSA